MKANEFVKKFGLDRAKQFVNADSTAHALVFATTGVSFIDLKRLVESHEIVEVGLPELKKAMFSDSKDLEYVKNWLLTVSEKLLTKKGIKLKQAIADVESLKEVS